MLINHLLNNFSDELDFEEYGDNRLLWCLVRDDDGLEHEMSLVLH